MDQDTGLRLRVLGELAAARDGAAVDLGGRRQRAVLAALIVPRGQVVPAERLAGSGYVLRLGPEAVDAWCFERAVESASGIPPADAMRVLDDALRLWHGPAFEVVTGDGVLRPVTPTDDPELFFGLRGGKGMLGIVTAVEFDLVRAVPASRRARRPTSARRPAHPVGPLPLDR